jgi:hypothetical protein
LKSVIREFCLRMARFFVRRNPALAVARISR